MTSFNENYRESNSQFEEQAGHTKYKRTKFNRWQLKLLERRFKEETARIEEAERLQRRAAKNAPPAAINETTSNDTTVSVELAALNLVIEALHKVFKQAPETVKIFMDALPDTVTAPVKNAAVEEAAQIEKKAETHEGTEAPAEKFPDILELNDQPEEEDYF